MPRRPATQPAIHSETAQPELFLSRELATLEFNFRVLAQARDTSMPLLERLRYLSTLDEARSRFAAGEQMAGPEVNRWFEAGKVVFPSAAILGQLATGRSDFVPGEKLEPIYLRETTFVKAPPLRVLPRQNP